MVSVASLSPTLTSGFACWWRPCGVTLECCSQNEMQHFQSNSTYISAKSNIKHIMAAHPYLSAKANIKHMMVAKENLEILKSF